MRVTGRYFVLFQFKIAFQIRGDGEMGELELPMPNAQCPMPNAQCPMPNCLIFSREAR
jgi:hypothetical protein